MRPGRTCRATPILPADQGTGLLPWSWALERLRGSHDYWVSTVWPDGRPHTMPVWGVWDDDGVLWFSASLRSRKIRTVQAGSAVTVSTEDDFGGSPTRWAFT